jgi:hypothetical protein
MKKARIILFSVLVLAVISTNLALKTKRFVGHVFYKFGVSTTTVGGPIVTGCVVPTTLNSVVPIFSGVTLTCLTASPLITTTCSGCTVKITISEGE